MKPKDKMARFRLFFHRKIHYSHSQFILNFKVVPKEICMWYILYTYQISHIKQHPCNHVKSTLQPVSKEQMETTSKLFSSFWLLSLQFCALLPALFLLTLQNPAHCSLVPATICNPLFTLPSSWNAHLSSLWWVTHLLELGLSTTFPVGPFLIIRQKWEPSLLASIQPLVCVSLNTYHNMSLFHLFALHPITCSMGKESKRLVLYCIMVTYHCPGPWKICNKHLFSDAKKEVIRGKYLISLC